MELKKKLQIISTRNCLQFDITTVFFAQKQKTSGSQGKET